MKGALLKTHNIGAHQQNILCGLAFSFPIMPVSVSPPRWPGLPWVGSMSVLFIPDPGLTSNQWSINIYWMN